jgi:hypothetical protein
MGNFREKSAGGVASWLLPNSAAWLFVGCLWLLDHHAYHCWPAVLLCASYVVLNYALWAVRGWYTPLILFVFSWGFLLQTNALITSIFTSVFLLDCTLCTDNTPSAAHGA